MNQADINREVARATGESVSTIRQFGFVLDEPSHDSVPEDLGPHYIDWDEREAIRNDVRPQPRLAPTVV